MSQPAPSVRTIMVIEVPHNGGKHRLHQFEIPSLNEPGGYFQLGSLENFRNHNRKRASKEDKETFRAGCAWGPTSLWICKDKREWEREAFMGSKSLKKAFPDWTPGEGYEGGEGKTLDEIPRTTHAGLYEFYQAIGFDRKARVYVDGNNQPIKYSITELHKHEQKN